MGRPPLGDPWRWLDIPVLAPFRFDAILSYLSRSPDECLFQVDGEALWRLVPRAQEPVAILVHPVDGGVRVGWRGDPDWADWVRDYVVAWLGLTDDVRPFLEAMMRHSAMGPIAARYRGLRLVGLPDLFEALSWAIIGQQITLRFAYTLKKRVTLAYGEKRSVAGRELWMFPKPDVLKTTSVESLTALGLSRQKARSLILVAEATASGRLTRERLSRLDVHEAERQLTTLPGVGPWTAQYVLMRCLRMPEAYPQSDVGLHNALKRALHQDSKPSLSEVQAFFRELSGFEAYATFYLWHDLSQQTQS